MTLRTTNTQHAQLWDVVTNARDGSTSVRVDKEALMNLLQDHIDLNSAVLRKHGQLPETKDG